MSEKVREAKRIGDAITRTLDTCKPATVGCALAAMIERTAAVAMMAVDVPGMDTKSVTRAFVDAIATAVCDVVDEQQRLHKNRK